MDSIIGVPGKGSEINHSAACCGAIAGVGSADDIGEARGQHEGTKRGIKAYLLPLSNGIYEQSVRAGSCFICRIVQL